MVPVQALEATSLAFIGHRWGMFNVGSSLEVRLHTRMGLTSRCK